MYLVIKRKMLINNELSRNQDNIFDNFIDECLINQIAIETGFLKRQPKKITPSSFVLGFIQCCAKSTYSFSQWAIQIGWLIESTVSKQAVFDRINETAVEFIAGLLKHCLQNKLLDDCKCNIPTPIFSPFGKILLQDSTTLNLSQSLADQFPGNKSKGLQKAVARVQTIINIKTMQIFQCTLASFTNNDQSASRDILDYLTKGDLVIRDLGYFVMDAFQEIIDREAYFVSRLKYGIIVYTKQGDRIDMAALLKNNKSIIEMDVLINKCKLPVRLVMIKLPDNIANEKVRKAKCDRNIKTNHSLEYYEWCRYNAYITNVPPAIWTAIQIPEVYKVRWQIEIIFKSWKSGMKMEQMLKGVENVHKVRVCISMMLLFITFFMAKIYMPYKNEVKKQYDKNVSLIKLSTFVMNNLYALMTTNECFVLELVAKHCIFEKRNKRINMTQMINAF